VNFTREPIIETIVSPKDGYKLCIKNSKIAGAEELFVDAVEVVSFGHAFFFRNMERPKPFLVPVSDYELFEVKETRVVLKNVSHDRNIKIGGGRDAPLKASKEPVEVQAEEEETSKEPLASVETAESPKSDKKRDRRRNRKRKLAEERNKGQSEATESVSVEGDSPVDASSIEAKVSSAMFANLLPPPPVLISERLARLREQELIEGKIPSELPKSVVAEPIVESLTVSTPQADREEKNLF